MENSLISQNTIEMLEKICRNVNRFLPLIYLPLGFTGNILNIITFTRRPLRTNPCTTFLLFSSIANLFHLIFGLITRIIMDEFSIDIESISIIFCKLKYYIMYVSASLSLYFLVLASIYRYCQSKLAFHQRNFHQWLNAQRLSFLIVLINCLVYLHILILFRINHYQTASGQFKSICYAIPGPYRVFLDFFLLVTWCCLPPSLILIFGILTIRNLRRTSSRAFRWETSNSITHQQRRTRQKIDFQLVFTLLLQTSIIICSTLPFGLQKIISNMYPARTPLQIAIRDFTLCFSRQMSFTNSVFCFFFYILIARRFRAELLLFFHEILFRFSVTRKRLQSRQHQQPQQRF